MIKISSPAFDYGDSIPEEYTCDGIDISPPLVIENVPLGAVSLVLIVDDPDAPTKTWTHWIAWNISSDTEEIRENSVPRNALLGINDFDRLDYGGPCPPSGTHRYYFRVYALDMMLEAQQGARRDVVESEMEGHVIDEGEYVGKYERRGV